MSFKDKLKDIFYYLCALAVAPYVLSGFEDSFKKENSLHTPFYLDNKFLFRIWFFSYFLLTIILYFYIFYYYAILEGVI